MATILGRSVRVVRSLLRSIHYSIWVALLTLFLVTSVFPVAAQYSPITPTMQRLADASTQLEQGRTLYEAGRFAEAAALWRQAAQGYEERGDRLNVALSLSYLSLAYQELGQWQEAQKAISQSLELIRNNQQPTNNSPPILAQALNTQGSLQLAMGQTEAALNTWKQAENVYADAGDEAGMLGSQINQAQALQSLGLYRRAKNMLEQVNKKLQAQPESLLKATGLRSLGVALQVVGNLEDSQKVLEQSLAITQHLDSPLDTSATLFSLGNTARALQDFPKALELYHKAAAKATNSVSKLEAQLNQLSLLVQTERRSAAQALLPQIQANLTNLPLSRAAVYAEVNLADSLMKLSTLSGNKGLQVGRLQVESSNLQQTNLSFGNAKRVQPSTNKPSNLQTYPSGTRSAYNLQQTNLQQTNLPFGNAKRVQPSTSSTDIAQLLVKAIQQARMLKDPRAESYALGQLGKLYEQTQQWSDARNLTQEALILAQGINASDIVYRWQWQLSRILKYQGDRTGAIASYTEAVHTLQSLRSDLVAINPDIQFSFRETVEPVYRELVELLLQPPPNPHLPACGTPRW